MPSLGCRRSCHSPWMFSAYRQWWPPRLVGWGCAIFMLVSLPIQTTEVSVLKNNMAVECWEACPCQKFPRVILIPKEQGGKFHIIVHTHFSAPPRCTGLVSNLPHSSAISSTSSAAASSAPSADAPYAHKKIREIPQENGDNVAPTI